MNNIKSIVRQILKESTAKGWEGQLYDEDYIKGISNVDSSDGYMVRKEGNMYRVVFQESGAYNENVIDVQYLDDYAKEILDSSTEDMIIDDWGNIPHFLQRATVYEKVGYLGSIYGFSDMFTGVPTMDLEDVKAKYF